MQAAIPAANNQVINVTRASTELCAEAAPTREPPNDGVASGVYVYEMSAMTARSLGVGG